MLWCSLYYYCISLLFFFLPSQLQKFQGGWSWTCHAPLYSFSSYISKGRPNSSCSAFKTRSITCNESAYSNFSLFIVSPEYWCLSTFLKYFHLTRIRHFLKQIEAIQFQFKKCGVFLSSFFRQEIFSSTYFLHWCKKTILFFSEKSKKYTNQTYHVRCNLIGMQKTKRFI